MNHPVRRRAFASGGLLALLPVVSLRADDEAVAVLLRQGGGVIAFRHAAAPGTFDPPGFKLGDCSTQRNLSEDGRAQARRIGAWFERRNLLPARVRSSPWCRCVDTASLAFGATEVWPALASPQSSADGVKADHLQQLRSAVQDSARRRQPFEVWVTHMFVLSALTGSNAASGDGLVLRVAGPSSPVEVLARLTVD